MLMRISSLLSHLIKKLNFLIGNINLNNVNVKPNKANKFLQSMMLPFALKAGTIGKLELKVKLKSFVDIFLLGQYIADVEWSS